MQFCYRPCRVVKQLKKYDEDGKLQEQFIHKGHDLLITCTGNQAALLD